MIIGLAGKAGSGKDTFASFMSKNKNVRTIAFADNLKKMAMNIFHLTHGHCYDQELKEKKFAGPIMLLPIHIVKIMEWAKNKDKFLIDEKIEIELYKKVGTQFHSPRELLQYLGTEILRDTIDTEYHVKVVKRKIDKEPNSLWVITDARFENEREIIKRWKGRNIFINRASKTNSVGLGGHASENSLGNEDDYDHVIYNNGTLEDLQNNANNLFSELTTR